MKTTTIQIGNSDDCLSQKQWSEYWLDVHAEIMEANQNAGGQIHFVGASEPTSQFQNACWVMEIESTALQTLKESLEQLRRQYNQDAIAITTGQTQMI